MTRFLSNSYLPRYIIITIVLALCSFKASAQNVQIHYDLGRNAATTTVEMFKADNAGNTFFFVDLDYNPRVSGAYWEIARELNFWQNSNLDWLSLHVEYNGGLDTAAGPFNNCWLGGLTYSGHSDDWSKTWSITAVYKAIPGTIGLNGMKQTHNFQLTGVWNLDFLNHWISFNGFADFWREARPWQGTEFIFISEPQIWVNLNNIKGWENIHLSLGTELELSYNFIAEDFHAMPTIAAKWTF